ncbi:hypothetical protein [Streptomyces chrestomyceticus]|uniref:Chaplin domain-containing protein n=1 Tax=Streptomyces chrestomyceticus TaxID=68185 RepID=A0ABU7WQR6_9ACTN
MRPRYALAPIVACCAALTAGQAVTAPATVAGGVGHLLSPAFGTACANNGVGARAQGTTTSSPDAGGRQHPDLPVTGPLNQCGGADLNVKPRKVDACGAAPSLLDLVGLPLARKDCD